MRYRLSLIVFAVTIVITTIGYLVPSFEQALDRDPALFHGELWRVITPILLNPEGIPQLVFNTLGFLIVAPMTEHVFGRARWAVLYVGGALAGEIYSYAVHDYSAGSSLALAGLLGGLAFWMVSGRARGRWARSGGGFMLLAAVWLAVAGDNHGVPILTGAFLAAGLTAARWNSDEPAEQRRVWRDSDDPAGTMN